MSKEIGTCRALDWGGRQGSVERPAAKSPPPEAIAVGKCRKNGVPARRVAPLSGPRLAGQTSSDGRSAEDAVSRFGWSPRVKPCSLGRLRLSGAREPFVRLNRDDTGVKGPARAAVLASPNPALACSPRCGRTRPESTSAERVIEVHGGEDRRLAPKKILQDLLRPWLKSPELLDSSPPFSRRQCRPWSAWLQC